MKTGVDQFVDTMIVVVPAMIVMFVLFFMTCIAMMKLGRAASQWYLKRYGFDAWNAARRRGWQTYINGLGAIPFIGLAFIVFALFLKR